MVARARGTRVGYDVRDFGSLGADADVNTDTIQAAIDYADANKGGTNYLHGASVILPAGVQAQSGWPTRGGITIPQGIGLVGESENGSTLRWNLDIAETEGITYCVGALGNRGTSTQVLNAYVKNLSIGVYGSTNCAALLDMLYFDYCVEPTLENVRAAGINSVGYTLTTGIHYVDCMNANVNGFVSDGGWTSILGASGASSLGLRLSRFSHMFLYGSRATAISLTSADDNIFNGLFVETYSVTQANSAGIKVNNSNRNNFGGYKCKSSNLPLANSVEVLGTSVGNLVNGIPAKAGAYALGSFENNLGLSIGNGVAATTPGAVVKKMEVFSAAGVSLGFVPIYDAIT